MPGDLFLGIDVGTQSTKVLVIAGSTGSSWDLVARGAQAYELLPGLPPGAAEQHPDTWIHALESTLQRVGQTIDLGRVAAIGVSGQQHGFVPLDAEGRVLRAAKLWCDTSTTQEASQLEALWKRPVPVGYTASKILWLAAYEPENWSRLAHVALPHDYVNFVLTGRLATECGDASGTGLLDPKARTWDLEAARAIDARLEGMLLPLVGAGEVLGTVSERAAKRFGLPEGAIVAIGGGDNMMAAIGAGAVRDGVTVVSLGTSGTLFVRSEAPVLDPRGLIAPFCDSTGAWLPLLCVMNLTLVTEEIRSAFALSHEEITERALRVPIGSDGPLMLPFLQGERVPALPMATGSLDGLRPGWLEPGRLYRAALEGCLCNLAVAAERLAQFGSKPSCLRIVGGAARNSLWQGAMAAAFGVPIEVPIELEAAAFGAALQAAWTVQSTTGQGVADIEALREITDTAIGVETRLEPNDGDVRAFARRLSMWREALRTRYGDV
ncbi:MAG: xylulokinase [Planctomycetes bacterium]|nr:xylulokinase [Planctomycetota bacterium]MCB9891066.1 xylulokinase [Planctomycetota bacterium]MCB9916973.1 xylulokinase [Planctomycetota bacterium]